MKSSRIKTDGAVPTFRLSRSFYNSDFTRPVSGLFLRAQMRATAFILFLLFAFHFTSGNSAAHASAPSSFPQFIKLASAGANGSSMLPLSLVKQSGEMDSSEDQPQLEDEDEERNGWKLAQFVKCLAIVSQYLFTLAEPLLLQPATADGQHPAATSPRYITQRVLRI